MPPIVPRAKLLSKLSQKRFLTEGERNSVDHFLPVFKPAYERDDGVRRPEKLVGDLLRPIYLDVGRSRQRSLNRPLQLSAHVLVWHVARVVGPWQRQGRPVVDHHNVRLARQNQVFLENYLLGYGFSSFSAIIGFWGRSLAKFHRHFGLTYGLGPDSPTNSAKIVSFDQK